MVDESLSLVCLDANIYPKLFVKEKDSSAASLLFEKLIYSESRIIEPSFLRIEFYSVIRKKRAIDGLAEQSALSALDLFDQLSLEFIQESDQLIREAYYLAERLRLTVVYDCMYLALSKENQASFITADERFAEQAKKIYSEVYSLKKFEVDSLFKT